MNSIKLNKKSISKEILKESAHLEFLKEFEKEFKHQIHTVEKLLIDFLFSEGFLSESNGLELRLTTEVLELKNNTKIKIKELNIPLSNSSTFELGVVANYVIKANSLYEFSLQVGYSGPKYAPGRFWELKLIDKKVNCEKIEVEDLPNYLEQLAHQVAF